MNHYYCDEPTLISFSGGRTSAFMLHQSIKAHGGKLPDHVKVCFANTGKEMQQTLDFVHECSVRWGVKIHWLEYNGRVKKENSKNYQYFWKEVDYGTASRNGEPFAQLIKDTGQLPNPLNRMCSGQMKIRTIDRFLRAQGFEPPYQAMIGIRADEVRRAKKMIGQVSDGSEKIIPLYDDGISKEDVGRFWKDQPFDLQLPNNNGVTDWGNCDLCFLKGKSKRMSIIQQRPDLVGWWADQEKKQGDYFNRLELGYEDQKIIATDQGGFDFGDDQSIPCFCGD